MRCPAGQAYYPSDHGCNCAICDVCQHHYPEDYELLEYMPPVSCVPKNIFHVGRQVCEKCAKELEANECVHDEFIGFSAEAWATYIENEKEAKREIVRNQMSRR